MTSKVEIAFSQLGRTAKSEFISRHIEKASVRAIAGYVESYIFDVPRDINNDEYIASYLREKDYKVEKAI